MLGFLKSVYGALSEGLRLNYVAMKYSDPDQLHRAMLIAMGAVLPEHAVQAKRPVQEERELIAA